MRDFKDFFKNGKNFVSSNKKLKIESILEKPIFLHEFTIMDSKFNDNGSLKTENEMKNPPKGGTKKECLVLKYSFEVDGPLYMTNTGSTILIKQLREIGSELTLPFSCTIVHFKSNGKAGYMFVSADDYFSDEQRNALKELEEKDGESVKEPAPSVSSTPTDLASAMVSLTNMVNSIPGFKEELLKVLVGNAPSQESSVKGHIIDRSSIPSK